MKILVIGGSYFYGRVFVMEAAKEHEITVVNRGTYSMESFGVTQLTGERGDVNLWKSVTDNYDVIVDFCGYKQGDVANVLEHLTGTAGQYIFISTVDVYQRGIAGYKAENCALETREFQGEAGEYIAGKVALEKELQTECEKRGIAFTILRPAILYGPYNYAPRESVFIQLMVQQGLLPRITDADGSFQMLYVKDAANAILQCIGNEKAYGQCFNLCGDETANYDRLADVLLKGAEKIEQEMANTPVREIPMTRSEAMKQGLPLSFPVTKAETELYSNDKSKEMLGMQYTSLEEGMARTCRAFWSVYGK